MSRILKKIKKQAPEIARYIHWYMAHVYCPTRAFHAPSNEKVTHADDFRVGFKLVANLTGCYILMAVTEHRTINVG